MILSLNELTHIENHIVVRLIGGLGNQMFQYAAARGIAERRGATLKLDISEFMSNKLRSYELASYNIKATIATPEELSKIRIPVNSRKSYLKRLIGRRKKINTDVYREPHFHFDPTLFEQDLPLYIEGYWQSEKYFDHISEEIRTELQPVHLLDSKNADIVEKIKFEQSISLHVRRGDYVTNASTNAYHGTMSLDYYSTAIKTIVHKIDDPHLFVFSDDTEWTRENLKTNLPTTYVSANPPDRGYRDLQLMSFCQHHIIANSSFSWWGAWLGSNPDKTVVAPKNWFKVDDKNTNDLCPEGWIKI